MDADATARYRRACDYLALAMIYLKDNVLVRDPLRPEHLKPRILGHWGTCPGLDLVYAGLDDLIRGSGQRTLLVTGPGHGAPAIHANLWFEGSHAERDPDLSLTGAGMAELVRRFSWPGGFPSHLSPEIPGVVHEGGELGYALATAAGVAMDKPDLLVACVVGDGEAETGPTAGSWQTSAFLDPAVDGAVLPILHLNGAKISSPTVFSTMDDHQLIAYFTGCGWEPLIVDITGHGAHDPRSDEAFADALAVAHGSIRAQQQAYRRGEPGARPIPPMIVLRSPKGMGAPQTDAEGLPLEGTFRAHQAPLEPSGDDEDLHLLERWLRSYRPEELFEADGTPAADLLAFPPTGELRLGSVPEANGGRLRRSLPIPELEPFATTVERPGGVNASPTEAAGNLLAEVMRQTEDRRDFRVVCPDELASNKLDAILEATGRAFVRNPGVYAEDLRPGGRVLEVLSEHLCQGWLQGYLLTGRHGVFPCYEAFASIVDSMANQYAKFLTMSRSVPWREPVSAMVHLLTSDGWRQEHNGYSHQGAGFLSNLLTKRPEVTGVHLPADANSMLVVLADVLAATDRIELVVTGKQAVPTWLSLDEARAHCRAGAAVWDWAGHGTGDPEVVLACAGTTPTTETLAAADLLRRHAPDLTVRVTNVVTLRSISRASTCDAGLDDPAFEQCFGTDDTPVVFAFHGYPSAVHELLHGRPGPNRFHVHGYLEEGTTTTPYILLADNRMTRHDLAADALRRALGDNTPVAAQLEAERDRLVAYANREGLDSVEITEWRWPSEETI
jgi:xylulose-5-phosphate/fructose-6-phosphate phosphoketolase